MVGLGTIYHNRNVEGHNVGFTGKRRWKGRRRQGADVEDRSRRGWSQPLGVGGPPWSSRRVAREKEKKREESLAAERSQSISKILAKSHSLYSHLAIHLAKIFSSYFATLQ